MNRLLGHPHSRAGITTVLLPECNRRDLEEIPEEARQKITIDSISEVDDLLEKALEPPRADTQRGQEDAQLKAAAEFVTQKQGTP